MIKLQCLRYLQIKVWRRVWMLEKSWKKCELTFLSMSLSKINYANELDPWSFCEFVRTTMQNWWAFPIDWHAHDSVIMFVFFLSPITMTMAGNGYEYWCLLCPCQIYSCNCILLIAVYSLRPILLMVFNQKSNLRKFSFWSDPNSDKAIATKFCTCHNNWAVVACGKVCSNMKTGNGITLKWNFTQICGRKWKLVHQWNWSKASNSGNHKWRLIELIDEGRFFYFLQAFWTHHIHF